MTIDVINLSDLIVGKIEELETERNKLCELGITKARDASNYDKKIAVVTLKLRNGIAGEFEGLKTIGVPVSIIDRIAKGMCYDEKLAVELSDAMYKSTLSNMNAIQAELNGYQSISRHLSSI
jgi:hypothetical protein